MARVDEIVDQQRAGHINLKCGLIATTFQQKCDLVLKKRREREVEEEPATVAGDDEHHQLEEPAIDTPDFESDEEDRVIVYEQDYTEIEIAHAENYATDEEVAVEAAQAYIASEDALLAHDITVGEDFAKTQALNEELNAQFYYSCFHVLKLYGRDGLPQYDDFR
jgi:hypothetical protein